MLKPSLLVLLVSTSPLSAKTLSLSEEMLISWAKESNHTNSMIELQNLTSQLNESSFNENFSTHLKTSYSYTKTKETSFSVNAPITSPVKNAQAILSKPTSYGLEASLKVQANQVSNSFYQSGTTAAFGVGLAMDLYKDLFGKTTRANLESLQIKSEIAKNEAEISKHAFVQEVRKLYWLLVANNESLNIAKSLFETAKKLEEDTSKRFKNNVADLGEYSRTKSQTEARNGQILILEFERSELYKKLKQLFPEKISTSDLSLASYSLDSTVAQVLGCTTNISSKDKAPFEYTQYDEVLELLKRDLSLSQRINNAYTKADVKLITEYNYIGKDFSHADAFDELQDNGRQQYSVGFQIDIPLDSKKNDSMKLREEVINKSNIAKYQEIEGKLNAFHTQTVKSIDVLYRVIAAQKRNAQFLNESLKISKNKFKQARLSARDLIQDEDSLLQSNLSEINTKYNIISNLIDYFSVFNSTPCSINK